MEPNVENFLIRYPKLKDIPAETISMAINDAMSEISRRVWGNLYIRGVFALAAHMLYLRGWPGDGGAVDGSPVRLVASQTASGLSESFVGGTGTDAEYEVSIYGQEYTRLRKLVRRHILVT